MSSGIKLSLIGAGSGQFSLGIVRDLCLTPELWGSTVSFMDINAERLDAVHNVATRYTAELGADLVFEKTLDRRASLAGADFVINTAMVGGWDRYLQTQAATRQHGYPQGLYLDNYYQYRLFMDVIQDMEQLCPAAWYIQSANPVFDGITLIGRQSKIKAVGLCHGYQGVRHVARVLGYEPDEIEAQSYGVNHFIWLTKFRHHGQDLYPVLDEWIRSRAPAFWASPECGISDEMGPKAIDVYRRLGLFPVGDTATPGGGSYFRWYHIDRETERRWHEDPDAWYERHISHVNAAVKAFTDLANDPGRRATEVFPAVKTHETNVSIINAIVNDRPGIFQVNVPNRGALPGVGDDVAVEVPALVSAAGIQPLRMEPLPRRIMCHMNELIGNMERELEAFVCADRKMLLERVLGDPLTRSVEQAQAVLDLVLALPENKEMAEYYC